MHASEWLTTDGFHIVNSSRNTAYPAAFPLVPKDWLTPFLILLFGAPTLLIFDRGGRIIKGSVLALAVYIQLVDQVASFTLNKMYIVYFFFIFIAPRPRNVSIDGQTRLMQSHWPARMVQATLLIQYTTAGLCKVFWGDWLKVHDILFGHSVGLYRTEIAALLIEYLPHPAWWFLSYGALLFELLALLLFLPRRVRIMGCLIGFVFHMTIAVMMKDLIYFSIQMVTTYVLFLPTEWSVAIETRLQRLPFVRRLSHN